MKKRATIKDVARAAGVSTSTVSFVTNKGLLLQAEAIMRDVRYDDTHRPATLIPLSPPGWTPDNRNAGFYVMTGYRTPWFGTMPFMGGEYIYWGKTGFTPVATAIWGGLNVRPTEHVVLKLQGTHVTFPGKEGAMALKPLDQLSAQIAWSF